MATNNSINQIYSATVTITNAQMKALSATPIEIVAAPGAGYIVAPICFYSNYIYGGNNAFTGTSIVNLYYGARVTSAGIIWSSSQINGTSSRYLYTTPAGANSTSSFENQSLTVSVSGAELGGNAANDNTMTIKVYYQIFPI